MKIIAYSISTAFVVLLSPGLKRLKEWAYVSFGITLLSACYSHYSPGDSWLALETLLTLAALIVSYRTRPATRELSVAWCRLRDELDVVGVYPAILGQGFQLSSVTEEG